MTASCVALVVLFSTGCDRDEVETWLSEGAPSEATANFFVDKPLRPMLDAFERRLGRDVRALSLVIYPDQAVLQAVNAHNAKAVDQYVYRDGKLSDPIAVKLMGKGKISDNAFALRDIDLAKLPSVVAAARRRIDIPEGAVSRVVVKRNLPESLDVRFRVFVTSQRRDGFIDADPTGKLLGDPKGPDR